MESNARYNGDLFTSTNQTVQGKRCGDCEDLWCLQYFVKENLITGYCPHLHKPVRGDDDCSYLFV